MSCPMAKPSSCPQAFAGLLGDDFQIGELFEGLVEAFVTILFRSRADLPLDNGDLAFAASNLANIFSQGSGRPDTVGGDKCVAGGIGSIAINRNDGNLCRLRCFDGHLGSSGARWDVNQGVHSTSDQVLNLAHLCGGVALLIDRDDLDALGFGLAFNRLFDLVEEVRLEIGNGQADCLLFFLCGGGGEGELAQIPAAAAAATMSLVKRFLIMVFIGYVEV